MAGNGTSNSPWEITNADELNTMRYWPSSCYILKNNIDISSYGSGYDLGRGWLPFVFSGTLDGDGHTVSNLYINRPDTDYVGLFSTLGGTVSNLTLSGIQVTGENKVGGLAGNCTGKAQNCVCSGAVTGTSMGENRGTGGLIGDATGTGAAVSGCAFSGTVTGSGDDTGGLVGYLRGGAKVTLCRYFGSVSGTNFVGGLVGQIYSGAAVSSSYAEANVSGSDYIGGLFGLVNSASASGCYACGRLTIGSTYYHGGIVGATYSSTVSSCYYNGEISGYYGNNGKTSPQMVRRDTYDGWDFTTVWAIDEGSSYPYLRDNTQSLHPAPPTVTISGSFTVSDKTYDGTTTAFITTKSLTLSGVSSGDTVALTAVASFSDANVAVGKTVTLAGSSLTGANKDKYILSFIGAPTATADITKISQATPAAPTVAAKTGSTVTLTAHDGYQYRVNGGDWQDSNVFTGLISDTQYSFTQRVKETQYCYASAESSALLVSVQSLSGSGTQADPYRIQTAGQLDYMRDFLDANFVMDNDIDLTGPCSPGGLYYNDGKGWLKIGDTDHPFTGTFDGQGHTITGLFINRFSAGDGDTGLFSFIAEAGVVKNLILNNINVTGHATVGGLVGVNAGTVSNCGVVGSSAVKAVRQTAGGLIGNNGGAVTNCYAFCSVNSTGIYGGGLIGYSGGSITNCYAVGKLTGTTDIGGLLGKNNGGAVTSCYYDKTVSNRLDTGKGAPLVTADMMKQASYTGWDFTAVWRIFENNSYPFLRCQSDWLRLNGASAYRIDGEKALLTGIGAKQTVTSVKSNFLQSDVLVYKDGVQLPETAYVGTGCVIKLTDENGGAVDELTAVVMGDLNGDSVVDALDAFLADKAVNGHSVLSGAVFEAANLDVAGSSLDINDYSAILNLAVGR